MNDRVLSQPDEDSEQRFRYEIIRNLAESIRQQTTQLSDIQNQMHNMSDRLTRIEANKVSEEVALLRSEVDSLKADRQRREGVLSVGSWLFKSPVIAWIAAAAVAVAAVIGREHNL